MEAFTTTKLLRWGNSYGLRLSKRDMERLGAIEGQEITVHLVTADDRIELPFFTFSSGHSDTSTNHDEVLYGWDRDQHRSRGD